jgi:chromosome segregation ATPase
LPTVWRLLKFYKEKRDEYERAKKEKDKVQAELTKLTDNFNPYEERKQELDKKLKNITATMKAKVYKLNKYEYYSFVLYI